MVHGITYADEAYSPETQGKMTVRFWHPVMKRGIITFPRPEDCPLTKSLREMEMKPFGEHLENFSGLREFEVKPFGESNFSRLREFGEVE